MTPFEAYKTYMALKKHFTSESYDYFKYNGKLKLNQDNFLKRKDKFFYEKLARKNDLVNFLLSNLVLNPNIWIRDLLNDSAEHNYTNWLKRIQSLTYTISQEASSLLEDFDNLYLIYSFEFVLCSVSIFLIHSVIKNVLEERCVLFIQFIHFISYYNLFVSWVLV